MYRHINKYLLLLTTALIILSLYLIFIWSPIEKQMGIVQKIFYFHVSTAWNGFFAFFIVFVFSILYLISRKNVYDQIAGVSAEIGILFTTIVLITGPIWGRSAWNTWWSWEPRLTTTLILWFIYVAYILIRNMDGPQEKKARIASVFGILGFINVPIVYFSINWWNSKLHPVVIGPNADADSGLESTMLIALIVSVIAMTILYLLLLIKGFQIEKTRITVAKIKAELKEKI